MTSPEQPPQRPPQEEGEDDGIQEGEPYELWDPQTGEQPEALDGIDDAEFTEVEVEQNESQEEKPPLYARIKDDGDGAEAPLAGTDLVPVVPRAPEEDIFEEVEEDPEDEQDEEEGDEEMHEEDASPEERTEPQVHSPPPPRAPQHSSAENHGSTHHEGHHGEPLGSQIFKWGRGIFGFLFHHLGLIAKGAIKLAGQTGLGDAGGGKKHGGGGHADHGHGGDDHH